MMYFLIVDLEDGIEVHGYGPLKSLRKAIEPDKHDKTCMARWEHSGFRCDWGVWKGCIVEVGPGVWLPQDALRDMDSLKGAK